MRRNVGSASLHRPCSARASALSAVMALAPVLAGALAAGGRFCGGCAKREPADSAIEAARQPIFKPIVEVLEVRTRDHPAKLLDVGTNTGANKK